LAKYRRAHWFGPFTKGSEGITQLSSFTWCRGLAGSIIHRDIYFLCPVRTVMAVRGT